MIMGQTNIRAFWGMKLRETKVVVPGVVAALPTTIKFRKT